MEKFEWSAEYEEAFSKVKEFLTSLAILTLPKEDPPLLLYLSINEYAMISVLVQEINKVEILVYFVSKMFKSAEARY